MSTPRIYPVGTIIRREYEPWLLGFCRWTHDVVTGADSRFPHPRTYLVTQTLRKGRWLWRGRRAPYIELVSVPPEIS